MPEHWPGDRGVVCRLGPRRAGGRFGAALIGDRPIATVVTGIRPGEKVHEILVSEEECHRTVDRGDYCAILPALPALIDEVAVEAALEDEHDSASDVMTGPALVDLLRQHKLMVDDVPPASGEILR